MQLPQAPIVVDAEVFHRPMNGGRNHALLISARTPQGESVQYVVKVPGLMDNEAFHPVPCLTELVAALLAVALQIRVPSYAAVTFGREFIDSVGAHLDGARGPRSLKEAIGRNDLLFGSAFEKASPFVRADLLDRDLRAAAADLLVFDVLVDNLDRRVENSNILQTRNELIAIDHGDAFSFLLPIIGEALFPDGQLIAGHACLAAIRRSGGDHFARIGSRIASLDDGVLDAIGAAVPKAWQTGVAAGKLEKILQVLKERRNTVGTWLPEIEARISQ